MDTPVASLELEVIHQAVEKHLARFFNAKAREPADAHLTDLRIPQTLGEFVFAGGKRLRPALCVLGWQSAGGSGGFDAVIATAASLELFHAFALIHDDVMDESDIRRGQPTLHRILAGRHADRPDPDRLGANAGILFGDLALSWTDEILYGASLTPEQRRAVAPILFAMRTEVMYGQYLDLLATGRPTTDLGHAMLIARLKTAKYTIERPLHLGAALAGGDKALLRGLTAFAIPVGEAFQLRDDLLGVYGDPGETGKSTVDDLRSGKHTVLMALALARAEPADKRLLRFLVGDPELTEVDAARVRAVLDATGARSSVERMIATRCRRGERALTGLDLPPAVTAALREFARRAAVRIS
ncbi:geranylgeranyl diphosphate synthase, type I [Amycolatopsis xylanica]|uniref:Geranylgeranyl diphosphate synthase, type I n=1 Tax=Amycolatopsis xylanica TaxID=589385 RepID=A0A1H3K5S6_9PSEU|nr:polyprenyl synthetase family protein [Amycolatopsis xylanica]SDY47511.1 geranylgeranyl diphosphate synthase, type I [Amycolatopsis xylanica]